MKRTIADYSRIKILAIDLDGVVYQGHKLIPGADRAIRLLEDKGYKVYFTTNNSASSRQEIKNKLNGLGIPAEIPQIINSVYIAINFLVKQNKKRFLLLGSDSFKSEFHKAGFKIVNDARCDYLVVGLDKNFTYEKISLGLAALRNKAKFIACNVDANYPVENRVLLPGCGAMVVAISLAAKKNPDVIIGKPNVYMLKYMQRIEKTAAQNILVVGDMLDSDIAMADNFGAPSIYINKKVKNSHSYPSLYALSCVLPDKASL